MLIETFSKGTLIHFRDTQFSKKQTILYKQFERLSEQRQKYFHVCLCYAFLFLRVKTIAIRLLNDYNFIFQNEKSPGRSASRSSNISKVGELYLFS